MWRPRGLDSGQTRLQNAPAFVLVTEWPRLMLVTLATRLSAGQPPATPKLFSLSAPSAIGFQLPLRLACLCHAGFLCGRAGCPFMRSARGHTWLGPGFRPCLASLSVSLSCFTHHGS